MTNVPPGGPAQRHPHLAVNQLPQHAQERLQNTRGAQGQRFFTSDFSVAEFLLVRECGFEAVGMVMGSSIYHVGYQQSRWSNNEEMTVLTQALYHARELAMARMEAEAEALGADGVVGLRLHVKSMAWGENLLEFNAIGTAICARDGQHGWRAPSGKPFTSDLTGQDFWMLLRSGFRPVSLVMGNCVYHVAHQSFGQWFKSAGQNTEMPNFTQALYDARELAMERMQYEAQADGATGIVGVDMHEASHGWGSHVMEFFAVGTSVLPYQAPNQLPPPHLVMTVNE
jgi:uncharacterized protein YbjQ (UPF0145 family)